MPNAWPKSDQASGDGQAGDRFGASVAVDGDWAVSGAPGVDADTGAAYTFNRADSVWSQHMKLYLASSAAGDNFGNSASFTEAFCAL